VGLGKTAWVELTHRLDPTRVAGKWHVHKQGSGEECTDATFIKPTFVQHHETIAAGGAID
jgi:hypothetical protein